MFTESDLLPLSALQHLVFCERQCALIHVEQAWEENRLTAEGRLMHDKSDSDRVEIRDGVRIVRGLRIRSLRLGLAGKADVVEFHPADVVNESGLECLSLHNLSGKWLVVPVEYKHGKPKKDRCDEVQLCAQAMCLEEMLDVKIDKGFLFYGKTRHRHEVIIDDSLKAETENLSQRLHAIFESGKTPSAAYEKKCKSCSLVNICLPKTAGRKKSAGRYLSAAVAAIENESV